MTNRKEKTYNIPKKGVQVMDEEMTAIEMQRFLNQQYAEGKTELEAYRNLMAIYQKKSIKKIILILFFYMEMTLCHLIYVIVYSNIYRRCYKTAFG